MLLGLRGLRRFKRNFSKKKIEFAEKIVEYSCIEQEYIREEIERLNPKKSKDFFGAPSYLYFLRANCGAICFRSLEKVLRLKTSLRDILPPREMARYAATQQAQVHASSSSIAIFRALHNAMFVLFFIQFQQEWYSNLPASAGPIYSFN